MAQEKIPTAEEWLLNHKEMSKYDVESYDEGGYLGVNEEALYKIMIAFAKLHCVAQAKTIARNAAIKHYEFREDWMEEFVNCEEDSYGDIIGIDKDSILNAYPLENIK